MAADFDELDAKIQAERNSHAIPAVVVVTGGEEYIKGFGVTNVDHPVPVDGDTVFRIGSTTKTFTNRSRLSTGRRHDPSLAYLAIWLGSGVTASINRTENSADRNPSRARVRVVSELLGVLAADTHVHGKLGAATAVR